MAKIKIRAQQGRKKNRLFTVMVLENGPSYQNGPGPFNNGPGPFNNSPLNLMDLMMVLGDGPGK